MIILTKSELHADRKMLHIEFQKCSIDLKSFHLQSWALVNNGENTNGTVRPRAIDFSFRVRVTALKITTNGRIIFEGLFLKGYDRMSKIPIPTVLHNKILYALFEIFSEI